MTSPCLLSSVLVACRHDKSKGAFGKHIAAIQSNICRCNQQDANTQRWSERRSPLIHWTDSDVHRGVTGMGGWPRRSRLRSGLALYRYSRLQLYHASVSGAEAEGRRPTQDHTTRLPSTDRPGRPPALRKWLAGNGSSGTEHPSNLLWGRFPLRGDIGHF